MRLHHELCAKEQIREHQPLHPCCYACGQQEKKQKQEIDKLVSLILNFKKRATLKRYILSLQFLYWNGTQLVCVQIFTLLIIKVYRGEGGVISKIIILALSVASSQY